MDYIELSAIVSPLEPSRDILMAQLAEIGFESFVETEKGLDAYIQNNLFKSEQISKLGVMNNSTFNIQFSIKIIKDQNWNETWEKSFNPIIVENRCCIRAKFHEKTDNIEYDIIINPKMSFGTGHHETTYLMVKRLLDLNIEHKNILDMGCGTGVLAILAKLKNANFVEAIDIDEWAYQNTIENIRNNNCENIKVLKGGAELLKEKKFDIVLANINRNILLNDLNKYIETLSAEGEILLSGFFNTDKEQLINKASTLGFKEYYSDERNEWAMLHLIKE